MKKLIVICGHCGVGKSTMIAESEELSGLPRADMKDAVLECRNNNSTNNYESMMQVYGDMLNRAFESADTCVAEGHFFEGSPSTRWLREYARSNGIELEFRRLKVPAPTSVNRLIKLFEQGDPEAIHRLKLLSRDLNKYGQE